MKSSLKIDELVFDHVRSCMGESEHKFLDDRYVDYGCALTDNPGRVCMMFTFTMEQPLEDIEKCRRMICDILGIGMRCGRIRPCTFDEGLVCADFTVEIGLGKEK